MPVRGREEWRLRNCLSSLCAQSHPFNRIVVVEEGESSRLKHLCSSLGIDYLRVLPIPGPFNRAELVNVGARYLQGTARHLVAVDMDAIALPHVVKQVADLIRAGEKRPISVRPRRLSSRIGTTECLSALASRAWDGGDHMTWGMFAVDTFARFTDLQGLDERFAGWGWEDTHYVRRAGGGRMADLGKAVLHQHHPAAPRQSASKNQRMARGPNGNDTRWGLRNRIVDSLASPGPVRGEWYGGS